MLPTADQQNIAQKLAWWVIDNGVITNRGEDAHAIEADLLPNETLQYQTVMAIVPAANLNIRWHEFNAITPKQALTVARLEAQQNSIEKNGQFTATGYAGHDDDTIQIISATIANKLLDDGLLLLKDLGIDPDILLPAGFLIPKADEGIAYRANIVSEEILRMSDAIILDEPAFRDIFIGDKKVIDINDDATDMAMVHSLARPDINLRQLQYAKRDHWLKIDKKQGNILMGLLASVLAATLLLGVAEHTRYSFAADNLDRQTLQEARKVNIVATDIASAEKEVNQLLSEKGLGAYQWSVPTSALFSSIGDAPNVSLNDLMYNSGGLLKATLAAPRIEDINPVLIQLQSMGYKVTAKLRSDSGGFVVADITVRAS